MSTKRHNPTATESNAIHLPKEQQLQREQQQTVIKVLDETRDNIKKTTNESKKEIPHDIQIVNYYQKKQYKLLELLQIIL